MGAQVHSMKFSIENSPFENLLDDIFDSVLDNSLDASQLSTLSCLLCYLDANLKLLNRANEIASMLNAPARLPDSRSPFPEMLLPGTPAPVEMITLQRLLYVFSPQLWSSSTVCMGPSEPGSKAQRAAYYCHLLTMASSSPLATTTSPFAVTMVKSWRLVICQQCGRGKCHLYDLS